MKFMQPRMLVRINLVTGNVGMHLELPTRVLPPRCKEFMKQELKESKREIRQLRSELEDIWQKNWDIRSQPYTQQTPEEKKKALNLLAVNKK